jgi:DinB superfamily
MDTQKLTKQVKETGTAVIDELNLFSEEQLNVVPFEGSWTGGQVAEHLLKSAGVVEVVFGRTTPTTDRPPDEKIPTLRIFLDFSIKMKSPDFILPSDGFHARQPLIDQLQNDWDRLGEAVDTLDLSETCLDSEMPNVGHMTRLEWISFYVYHSKRHLHQLKNIHSSLQSGVIR